MDILEQYIKLTEQKDWDKALPLIEKIIEDNPSIQTSWFNYGVCLDALGRYDEASKVFIKAYTLDPNDYGAQYRIFRSLSLSENEKGFADFLLKELEKTPEILELIIEDKNFEKIIRKDKVNQIVQNFKNNNNT